MVEFSTIDSFIVRVYRHDTKDSKKIAGMLETTDGSGVRKPFKDMDEICAILDGLVNRNRKGRKRIKTISGGV